MRCTMCTVFSENGVSFHTRAEMVECLDGKTIAEKELLAEQLIEIITTSATEEEMIARAINLRQNDSLD